MAYKGYNERGRCVNTYRNKVTGFPTAFQGYNERGRCVNIYGNKVTGFHRAYQGYNERGRCVNIYENKVTGFHRAYQGHNERGRCVNVFSRNAAKGGVEILADCLLPGETRHRCRLLLPTSFRNSTPIPPPPPPASSPNPIPRAARTLREKWTDYRALASSEFL
jgi:hypothetical protein